MQDQNVQTVRRLMTAFNLRDLDGVLEVIDPAIEFFAPQTAIAVERHSSYNGQDGIRQYFDDVAAVWTRLQLTPTDFRSSDSHVVALGSIDGERDGRRVDEEVAWAWKLRDGKVVWGRVYGRPDEALEDAGLR